MTLPARFGARSTTRLGARSTVRAAALVLLAGVALATSATARATDYIVEIVLFETLGAGGGGGELWFPKVTSALGLSEERAAAEGFRLVERATELDGSAAKIAASGRYRLLRHFAWRQPGLPRDEAVAVRVNLGRAFDMYLPEDIGPYERFIPASIEPRPERTRAVRSTTVNGTLKVYLGRFLHLESLLVFTDEEAGRSYRLFESRKMRSTELHYVDNPRFGLLARIVPIEEGDG